MLAHLPRSLVHPLHHCDELALQEGDERDGPDNHPEEVRTDGVDGVGVGDHVQRAVEQVHRHVEDLAG